MLSAAAPCQGASCLLMAADGRSVDGDADSMRAGQAPFRPEFALHNKQLKLRHPR